jgi:hypothetical protein
VPRSCSLRAAGPAWPSFGAVCCEPQDAPLVRRQLQAHYSEAVFQQTSGALEAAWQASGGDDILVFEVGLAHEFMLPLASSKVDPFVGIVAALAELKGSEPFVGMVGALADLQQGELGLYQVIFQETVASI